MYEITLGKALDTIQQLFGDDARITVDACYVEKNSRHFHSYIGTLCYNKPIKLSRVGMISDLGVGDAIFVPMFRDRRLLDFESYYVDEVSYRVSKAMDIDYIDIEIEIPISAGVLKEGL